MDENTRPWYTIDELNASADKYQNEQWHKAAIRLGEELSSVGPVGYYEMDASEWLDWAMANVKSQIEFAPVKMVAYNCLCGRTMKFESEHGVIAPQRTWVGLTDEEIEKACVPLGAAILSFTEVARAIKAKLKELNS
jgi:hypothetical protein